MSPWKIIKSTTYPSQYEQAFRPVWSRGSHTSFQSVTHSWTRLEVSVGNLFRFQSDRTSHLGVRHPSDTLTAVGPSRVPSVLRGPLYVACDVGGGDRSI